MQKTGVIRAYLESVEEKWADRESMYHSLLGPGLVGCELGVEHGNNSEALIKSSNPSKLYLIDRWRRTHNAPKFAARQEGRFRHVKSKFKSNPRVSIIRESTDDASHRFSKESLDWIYIDANHVFAAALLDVQMWSPKIKPGGVLMLHDFSMDVAEGGVAEAAEYALKGSDVFEVIGKTSDRGEVQSAAYRKQGSR